MNRPNFYILLLAGVLVNGQALRWQNELDLPLQFNCPSRQSISHIKRWRFFCCRVNSYCNQDCQWTPYVNYFDELISWKVPSLNYLVGAGSYHSNPHEDRRWRYQYCTRTKNC
ncbi:unnamed protein product [Coregonus sp. 'balchen']|nr:unnamed protein product [Coregonus sp. 'balchen']